MTSKKRNNKSKKQQQQDRKAVTTGQLSSFSLAAAISEASASTQSSESQKQQPQSQKQLQQPREILNIASQQSLATNTSFITANDREANENSTAAAASYFVDSSEDDDDDTADGLNFGNDPLAVLSRTTLTAAVASPSNNSIDSTPTEISFSNSSSNNPEETMPSKKNTMISPVVPVDAARTTPAVTPPKEEPTPADVAPTTAPQAATTEDDTEAHFDIAQNAYTGLKDIWSWGRSVPIITDILGLTEAVAARVLDTTVHMDLPALDSKAVTPQLKKLDDDFVTPAVLAVWKILEPVLAKSNEAVLQPVLKEVMPRVLLPVVFLEEKKKDWERKKEEERRAMVDCSPTPEVVPAPVCN